ncbi:MULTISPECIES: RNase RNM [unclassified Arsukibacterium]|uniref:RNase RNM n=1 Tax=unclassified Arsukibacterium TaxID=2635278 RepID=UPI000C5C5B77|nr:MULTISPECIES: PHP domain-containing protein [unclassified Arsukibacterium]MAA96198.1 phosphatase [Rheinheimera sp.]MBM35055.1 phosphatase [Rheinheimera sp.]HAW92393.1 phosphatase [Candidatus Azambacteria bacterium]|tara:strand:+ start:15566 stop:16402 length:837 start_codon:yes stop_codon:yes gene_type:complete
MKFDLHSHTHCSDGVLSPAELVMRATARGVNALAITDHDTVAGLAPAQAAISEQQLPLQLVNGVEISTRWQQLEIHIVGLNIDPDCPLFLERLALQQQRRLERAEEMARRLEKSQIPDVLPAVLALANGAALTRTHFARHLVNIGKASSINNVFKKYLGRGKTGYVPSNWVEMADAVQWIHDAGGVAVLAHPLKYQLTTKWVKRLAEQFAAAGGDAIEIISPQQTPVQKRELWALCQLHGLTASVGSDFHQQTSWNDLGKNLYLTDDVTPVWHNWALN